MKLIVGLGNPGQEYARTRHNAGFMALDRLAARHAPGGVARHRFGGLTLEARIAGPGEPGEARALLLKPMTFMNRSGGSVGEAVRFYKLDPSTDLLVIVDDVWLDCGQLRIRAKGSDGGHNGLADVERVLATTEYARCRIGIGPKGRADQVGYVLGRFSEEQFETLGPVLDRAADAAEEWALSGIDAAMNRFNVRPSRDGLREAPEPEGGAGEGESTDNDKETDAGEQPGA